MQNRSHEGKKNAQLNCSTTHVGGRGICFCLLHKLKLSTTTPHQATGTLASLVYANNCQCLLQLNVWQALCYPSHLPACNILTLSQTIQFSALQAWKTDPREKANGKIHNGIDTPSFKYCAWQFTMGREGVCCLCVYMPVCVASGRSLCNLQKISF